LRGNEIKFCGFVNLRLLKMREKLEKMGKPSSDVISGDDISNLKTTL